MNFSIVFPLSHFTCKYGVSRVGQREHEKKKKNDPRLYIKVSSNSEFFSLILELTKSSDDYCLGKRGKN